MLKPFSNRSLYPILEAYMSMNEALTIPLNQEDELEKQLYSKLDKNYKYADFIVRWYRNDKKALIGDDELQRTYVYNLKNILDLLKDYDEYIAELQRSHSLKETINLPSPNGGTWKMNPIKDFASIRRLDGVKALVKYLGDLVHSASSVKSTNSKYAITDADRRNIRLVGFSENVCCWATKTFESTNKFVFQLWQNSETMDRGDAYGNPRHQSPYCTHAPNHWNSYSEGYPDYEQYWFLKRITAVSEERDDGTVTRTQLNYALGDLTNPAVVSIFNMMAGTGFDTLIAMNDTGDDFLDRNDRDFNEWRDLGIFGEEVGEMDEILFTRIGETNLEYDSGTGKLEQDDYGYENDTTVYLKADGKVSEEDTLRIINVRIEDSDITELPDGIPEKIEGDFNCSGCTNLKTLNGMSKEIGGEILLSGCDNIDDGEIETRVNVNEAFRKVAGKLGYDQSSVNFKEDGSVEMLINFDEIETVYEDRSGRDDMSFDTVKAVIEGVSYGIFDNGGSSEIAFDWLDTKVFDERMKEYGLSFNDIKNIWNRDGDYLVDEGILDDYKLSKIEELLYNDFYEGNNLQGVYSDCEIRGSESEAYEDVWSKLFEQLPADESYGIQDGKIKLVLNRPYVIKVVKNNDPSYGTYSILELLLVDEYGDYDTIRIPWPQYGYGGFDKEMWNEALTNFTNNVEKILNSTSPVKDAEGQQFFGFDKDYRQQ